MTHPDRPARRAHTSHRDLSLLAWPLGLVLLLALLAAWRVESRVTTDAKHGAAQAPQVIVERRAGTARIDLPRDWVSLEHAADHATWGAADRSSTVTVAQVESTAAPLPAVVAAVAADASAVLPGARVAGRPVELDVGYEAPRDDAAMLIRFVVEADGSGPLHVEQVWRRDTRAGVDVVATWTSADGHWPRSPRRSIPRADASG